jgi:hypothetical protein
MDSQESTQAERKRYPDRLAIYHARSDGEGAALRLEPRVNRKADDRYNCFFLEMARQKTRAEGSARPTFDWENRITVRLGFADLCEFLTVLEGSADRVGGKRDGLYHQAGGANTLIRFGKREGGGYGLSLSRKAGDADAPVRVGTALSETEATGLRCLLQTGLFVVTFPSVFAGDEFA